MLRQRKGFSVNINISCRKLVLSLSITLGLAAAPLLAGHPIQRDLDDAILGAIVYLDDTQIRNRPGRQSSIIDASDEGEGCKGKIVYSTLLKGRNIEIPILLKNMKIRNRSGEWTSFVNGLPGKLLRQGKAPISIQDSSLFVPAFVSYPLFLIEDGSKPVVEPMIDLAMKNINCYWRGNAYNFWPLLPQETCPPFSVTGPMNIPIGGTEAAGKALISPITGFLFNIFGKEMVSALKPWVKRCLVEESNLTGGAAFFNVPNDADDSSVAISTRLLYNLRKGTMPPQEDLEVLRLFSQFRDLDRTMEDGRDSYKGKNSGAFLTWLKDENEPTFAKPNNGVIPLGVNNVDAVVNGNVLFSLALNNLTDLPGYKECTELLAKAIDLHVWPKAGLYYPQQTIFPYTVTRAYRDGGARSLVMKKAMKVLLSDLLNEQDMTDSEHTGTGAFSGGVDKTTHLSTALGCIALMNIGEELAEEAGLLERYTKGLEAGINYLLTEKKRYSVKSPTTFGRKTSVSKAVKGYQWDDGLFFSASFWELAQWRSKPYSIAMIMEAFIKYRLGYHKLDCTIVNSPKLSLNYNPEDERAWSLREAD